MSTKNTMPPSRLKMPKNNFSDTLCTMDDNERTSSATTANTSKKATNGTQRPVRLAAEPIFSAKTEDSFIAAARPTMIARKEQTPTINP